MKTTTAAAYRHLPITIVEPDAGVAWVISRYARFIRRTAHRMAPNDSSFWRDLIQEGEIALWEAQHWRLDLDVPEDDRYLRRLVVRRMRRASRLLHRQAYPRCQAVAGLPGQSLGHRFGERRHEPRGAKACRLRIVLERPGVSYLVSVVPKTSLHVMTHLFSDVAGYSSQFRIACSLTALRPERQVQQVEDLYVA